MGIICLNMSVWTSKPQNEIYICTSLVDNMFPLLPSYLTVYVTRRKVVYFVNIADLVIVN